VARAARVPRIAAWDSVFIRARDRPLLVIAATPPWYVIAAALWWNANTISHNFIHRPFFGTVRANRAFSFLLSLVLGFPQTIWRDRHLRTTRALATRCASRVAPRLKSPASPCLFGRWQWSRRTSSSRVCPGWFAGLGLCWLHGHYEHARGTTSHYGRLYNLLFFNDGYHVEHHAPPDVALDRASHGPQEDQPARQRLACRYCGGWTESV
jgi:fatty acid desaturase